MFFGTLTMGQNALRTTGRLLSVGVLVAATAAPSVAATGSGPSASAVERWSKGDWWKVQLEQQALQGGSRAPGGWLPSFELHFEVTEETGKELRVEVRTIPENRFREELVLRYSRSGKLLSAQIVDGERVTPLGSAGGCGVFGMLGREAFELLKAPGGSASGEASVASAGLKRVAMDEAGETAQTWRAGEAYWRVYESRCGLPQRATRVAGSWKALSGGHRP